MEKLADDVRPNSAAGAQVKPGRYGPAEARKAEEAYWAEHGYQFGSWQFLPCTGEIRRNGHHVARLTPTHAAILGELIAVYPRYVAADSKDAMKTAVNRLRQCIGRDSIVAVHSWGYRFNPEGVMAQHAGFG